MAGSYYEVLGAAPGASAEDLRRAYRAAVKTAHPDTGGTPESFRAVQDAWAVLRDPTSRKAYDVRARAAAAAGARVNGFAGAATHEPSPRPAGPPRPAPPRTEPPAEASAPRATDPPADDAAEPDVGPWPDPGQRARRRARILLGVVITVAGVSGLLAGAIVSAIFGRFGAVAAGVYLLLVATAVLHQWQGTGEFMGLVRTLRRACSAVVALWAVIAAVSWAGESPWLPAALYAAVFAGFGAAVEWLTRAEKGWR